MVRLRLAVLLVSVVLAGVTVVLGNNIIEQGELNEKSEIIHTSRFDTAVFFSGIRNITTFKVSHLNSANNATLRPTLKWIGGVNHNFVYIYNPNVNNYTNENFVLHVYADIRDIRDITSGIITRNSRLLHTQMFTENAAFLNVNENITAFQILDHSPIELFTSFEISGGVGQNFVYIKALNVLRRQFELIVYGGPSDTSIDRNNTITVGELSNKSRLIHSELITEQLTFVGTEQISAFEIIDLTAKNPGIVEWFGGIGYDYLFVVAPNIQNGSSNSLKNYDVRIYVNVANITEPPTNINSNDLFVGELNTRSYAFHTQYFDNTLTYFGSKNITAFRVTDLVNGTTSPLGWLGGIGATFLFLAPTQYATSGRNADTSNFFITIYSELEVEPPSDRPPNDYFVGNLTESSFLAHSQHLNRSDLYLDTFEVSTNNVNVTRVELWDNTVGYGGRVLAVQIAWWRRVVIIVFEHVGEIDFQLEIFGERGLFTDW